MSGVCLSYILCNIIRLPSIGIMMDLEKLNYGTVLTPLLLLTFSLLLHSFLTVNDSRLGNVFGLDNTNTADFSFAAVGDWGCTPDTKNTVRNIVDKNPELVLGLGDFAYRNNATCWFSLTAPIHDKMKITIGNHDLSAYTSRTEHHPSPERLQEYMNKFNLSSQYYSFNFQDVHFLSMSSEIPYEKGSEQYDFVKKDLQNAASKPGIDWIVVFYHRVAYTSPVYLENSYLREEPPLRDTYHPLFEKYGVDLVIQGHSHNYQRTYPIKFNSNDPSQPFIVDRNTTNYYHPKGQIYTIVGTAGRPDIHNFAGPASPYTANQFIAFGFLNIDVLHNGTLLKGKFYDNNGTTSDHFTIDKSNTKNKKGDSSSTSPAPPSNPRLTSEYFDRFQLVPVFSGVRFPTDMAFLGIDDFLVL